MPPVLAASRFAMRCRFSPVLPRSTVGRGRRAVVGRTPGFVCFALSGLLSYPQFFAQPGIADAAAWCADWLEHHQIDQGWPEVAGVDDPSLHQTARAVIALSGLRKTLTDLGPGFVLPGGHRITILETRTDVR
jgi:hypothetical protein